MEWFVCPSHDGGYIFVTSSVRDAVFRMLIDRAEDASVAMCENAQALA